MSHKKWMGLDFRAVGADAPTVECTTPTPSGLAVIYMTKQPDPTYDSSAFQACEITEEMVGAAAVVIQQWFLGRGERVGELEAAGLALEVFRALRDDGRSPQP